MEAIRLSIDQMKRYDENMWLILTDAAILCGVSTRTIQRWCERGYITKIIDPRSFKFQHKFSLVDLDCWLPDIQAKKKHHPRGTSA